MSDAPTSPATDLVGRDEQLATIAEALTAILDGRSRVVAVQGDAGAGKTALIRTAVAAATDLTAVVLHADELLSDVPFAALQPFVHVPIDAGTFEGARAVLSRLAELAPVVLVVEDLHWADVPSRQALAIAAGRLDNEAVALVVSSRPEHAGADDGWARLRGDPSRCTRIVVGALDDDAVIALAATRGIELDRAAARRLVEHTGGNALYTTTLLDDVPADVLVRPGRVLPVPAELSAVVGARLDVLSPDTVRLFDALAVLGRPTPLPTISSLAALGDADAAMEAALATRFVEWRHDDTGLPQVAFAHPLLRLAVYEAMPLTRRRELHRSAAQVSDNRSALAHRVAAADRVDEALAAQLEAEVPAVRHRDGTTAAAQVLRWSSDLSADPAARERRLLGAAILLGADDDAALDDYRQPVEACADSPARDLVLGHLAWRAGDFGEATHRLERAAAATDDDVAVPALIRLAAQQSVFARGAAVVEAATAAIDRGITDELTERRAWALRALGVAQRDGAVAGLELLHERLPGAAKDSALIDAPLLGARGTLRSYALRPTAALDDLAVVIARPSATLQARRRAHVDVAQCQLAVGRWDEAVVNARLSLELSDDQHQFERSVAHQVLATVAAARGDFDAAAGHVAIAQQVSAAYTAPETALAARLAATALALARGADELVAVAASSTNVTPMLSMLAVPHPAALARLAADDVDGAEALAARLESDGRERRLDVAAAVADLRGRIAARRGDPTTAGQHFAVAVGATTPDTPVLIAAGIRLAHGRLLRSQAKRHEALDELRTARELYAALGAAAYLERVDQELSDAGLSRPTKRRDRSPLDFTPREQDVVTLVVQDRTNREIANELFISEKAVEYHLRNVYGKVGVSSRRELRSRLAA